MSFDGLPNVEVYTRRSQTAKPDRPLGANCPKCGHFLVHTNPTQTKITLNGEVNVNVYCTRCSGYVVITARPKQVLWIENIAKRGA